MVFNMNNFQVKLEEYARPIQNNSNPSILILRTFIDLKLASIFYSINNFLKNARGRVLELGCGNQPYRFLIKNATYVGIDQVIAKEFFPLTKDVSYYDGNVFPLTAESFDFVFFIEVLEHVEEPEIFIKECRRVLKREGSLLFTAPFNYKFHYIPYDYYRYTPSGLARLLKNAGFKDIQIDPQGSDVTVACYKVLSIFYRLLTGRYSCINKILSLLAVIILMPLIASIHLLGMFSLFFHIGSDNDPLGYRVIAKKI